MDIDDDEDLSNHLDHEDRNAIVALTAADVIAIDQAILSQLSVRWQKTALVVVKAMHAYADRYLDIPDVFYGQRIIALADQGMLEANGNLRRMRFSEVRVNSLDNTLE